MTKEQAKAAALRWLDEATGGGLALDEQTTADLRERMDHLLDGAVAAVCGRFPQYMSFSKQPQPEMGAAYAAVTLPQEMLTLTEIRLQLPDGQSLPFSDYSRAGRGVYSVPAAPGGVLVFNGIRAPRLPGVQAAETEELDVAPEAAVLVPLRLAADVTAGVDETAAVSAFLSARYSELAAVLTRRPEPERAAVVCIYAQ